MEERKARTHKGRKILDHRKGVVNEGEKAILFMRGNKTNNVVGDCLRELVRRREDA
jgi:ribosome production factor 2